MSRVYIESNGCAVLRHETYRIGKYFAANGWHETDSPDQADIAIYTGCGVIDLTQTAAVNAIRGMVDRARPDAELVVAGCLPSIDRDAVSEISPRLRLIENQHIDSFDDLIGASVPFKDVVYNTEPKRLHSLGIPKHEPYPERTQDDKFIEYFPEVQRKKLDEVLSYTTKARHLFNEPDLFEIRATWGCARKCGFCAIKLAIGEIESKPIQDILREVRDGIARGYKKIMLMGDEVGYYGNDIGLRLADLVEAIYTVVSREGADVRLGIRYVFPDALVRDYDRLKPYLANGFIYYFCSAFQSGSATVLRRMNRNPNLKPFLAVMEDINQQRFPVYKHTQVIIGYPGETEADLLETVKALTAGAFDFVTLAEFSARKGTKAADLDGQISADVKRKRFDFMTSWFEMNRSARLYERYRDAAVPEKGV